MTILLSFDAAAAVRFTAVPHFLPRYVHEIQRMKGAHHV